MDNSTEEKPYASRFETEIVSGYGFYWTKRKHKNIKVLMTYKGPRVNIPDEMCEFNNVCEEVYQKAVDAGYQEYEGWDAPHFKK